MRKGNFLNFFPALPVIRIDISTWIAIPVLLVLIILQMVVIPRFTLIQGMADLMLLGLCAWSLQRKVHNAWQWAIIGGLMAGYVSAFPWYVPVLGYITVVGLAMLLRRRLWQVPILAMFILTFLGTILFDLALLTVLRLQNVSIPLVEALNTITLPSLLLNFFLTIPFFALFSELADWIYPEELEV